MCHIHKHRLVSENLGNFNRYISYISKDWYSVCLLVKLQVIDNSNSYIDAGYWYMMRFICRTITTDSF